MRGRSGLVSYYESKKAGQTQELKRGEKIRDEGMMET